MAKNRITYLLPFFLVFSFLPGQAAAQFEGEITFRAYEPERAENPQRYLQFVATPERIYLSSNDRYKVFSGLDANGFLVRNDQNDFVFISGEDDALRISKEDVSSLANLIERVQGSAGTGQQFDWDGRLQVTGETKTIAGHRTEQIKVFEEDSENYVSVWLTDEIKVNWGILENSWHHSLSKVVEMDLPIEVFMNRQSFPLQMEFYRNNTLETVVEATRVNRRSIDRRLVEIPEGVKLLGITDLMMNMMRDRR
jgi:hypothetical protein